MLLKFILFLCSVCIYNNGTVEGKVLSVGIFRVWQIIFIMQLNAVALIIQIATITFNTVEQKRAVLTLD